jgi:glycosyltransferase involved in cell wall biosynthesis
MEPRLTVVVPCLNAAETIGGQLDALARQQMPEPWEVVLVDNRWRRRSVWTCRW